MDNRLLDAVEFLSCAKSQLVSPPIFIVGAPKSGSTLIYQLLILNYGFSFIHNFCTISPSLPGLLTRLARPVFRYPSDIRKNKLGFIPGLWAPSEAGALMNKWFGLEISGHPEKSIANIQRILKAPFLIKNTYNSGRVERILDRFPDAVFIHIQREPLENIISNYIQARNRPRLKFGYYPETNIQFKNLQEQESWRVLKINRAIEMLADTRKMSYIRVRYEELCPDAESVLRNIVRTLESFNIRITTREAIIPKLSPRSSRKELSQEEIVLLRQSLDKFKKILT
jgi:hypothetical protein